jgi:hypothetical protein
MRSPVTEEKLHAFLKALGNAARGPGRVYIVGGSTALLLGFRTQTIDIDLKLEPEPAGVFEPIARLKKELGVNVELAAPDDFIPPLPGWKERSQFILRAGSVDFYHYDFYGQALAKIERGHEMDLGDAEALLLMGVVQLQELRRLFEAIQDDLLRYPAIDAEEFRRRVELFVEQHR